MLRHPCIAALVVLVALGSLSFTVADQPRAAGEKQITNSIGDAYLENGERDKAIDAFTEAIRLRPNDARIYYLRASVYQRNGDAKKAETDLMLAVQLDPKGLWDYLGRGWAYGRIRDLNKAIANLTKAIDVCADRQVRPMFGQPI